MLPVTQVARDAVRRGHRRDTVLQLWTPEGCVGDLPYTTGSLTVSLSGAAGQRSGSVRVPGYDWWPYLRPSACPWIDATVSIDGEVFHVGEFPIVAAAAERPTGTIEVTLGDWAFRRERWAAESTFMIVAGLEPVAAMVERYLEIGWPVAVARDDTGGAHPASDVRVQSGGSVWRALTEAANSVGAIIMHTARGAAEVRVFDPAAAPVDALDGTVVRDTSAMSAGEAVNRVVVEVQGEGADAPTYTGVVTLDSGPYAYGGVFGPAPLVDTMRVPQASQALADAEARRLFDRRVGVVRPLGLDVVPQPWLQAGDAVSVTPVVAAAGAPGPESHLIDSVTHPVGPGTMRLVMREAGVTAG